MTTRSAREFRTVELGDVDPARTRHGGRRSAVALTGGAVVVGTASGTVDAYDRQSLSERWRADPVGSETDAGSVVSAVPFEGAVAVGERGPAGAIRLYDVDTGGMRWRYETAADVGEPQRSSRFFLPFVVDLVAGDRLYAAARRYERDGDRCRFSSVVYAFEPDGEVAWTCEADASPIALDLCGRHLAVAYNRCPGDHDHGLVVLDAETGATRWRWDPGTDGGRRVGDVSLLDDGAVVASHGDYRGYHLGSGGEKRWCADLAGPTAVGDEVLYAYPNHAHATADGVVFVTGNTYPTEGRETESLHPDEHTAFGYTPAGERAWSASVGGFAGEVGTDGNRVAVPGAQHFRARDADRHGLRVFDATTGSQGTIDTAGVVTAADLDGETVGAVEEPVVYHDDGVERGAYRLLSGTVG